MVSGRTVHPFSTDASSKGTSSCKFQHSVVASFCEPHAKPHNHCTAVPVNGLSSTFPFRFADSSSESCVDVAACTAKAPTADVRHAVAAVASGRKNLVDSSSGSQGSEGVSFLNAVLGRRTAHSMNSGCTVQSFSTEASSKCCAENGASTFPLAGNPSKASTTKLVACHASTNHAKFHNHCTAVPVSG